MSCACSNSTWEAGLNRGRDYIRKKNHENWSVSLYENSTLLLVKAFALNVYVPALIATNSKNIVLGLSAKDLINPKTITQDIEWIVLINLDMDTVRNLMRINSQYLVLELVIPMT